MLLPMMQNVRPLRPLFALLLGATALVSGCNDGDDPQPTAAPGAMYVVNQGNFGRANAAVTRYDRANGAAVRDQFAVANPGVALGDVAQSMTVYDGKGYIVVNNTNKIVVVQMSDFKQIAEITGLALPRYMAVYGTKGYVTEWVGFSGNGRISEIDLTTNALTGRTFPTGELPEEIVATPTGVLAANSGGSSLTNLTLLVTTATATIPTGADGPTAVRLDANGRVWVLCSGRIAYTPSFDIDTLASTRGALLSFALTNPTASTVRLFNRKGTMPGNLTFNPDRTRLYYTYNGSVFAMGTSDATLPSTAFVRRSFGALGVDPTDGTIYAADQRSYTGDGRVLRYRSTGAVLDSFNTAVGPTQFVF
jgi:DNA-binding beta-propeller fold protein YncE